MKLLAVAVSAAAIVAAVAAGVAALYISDESVDSRAEWSSSATHTSVVSPRRVLAKYEGPVATSVERAAPSHQAPVAALASADERTVINAWFPVH